MVKKFFIRYRTLLFWMFTVDFTVRDVVSIKKNWQNQLKFVMFKVNF